MLGPGIDHGSGAWAFNATSGFDVRALKWLIFSFEVQASYRFAYERDAPKWLPVTDCKRLQDQGRRDARQCDEKRIEYDKAHDLEQSRTFPNLEGLGATYEVQPGLSTGFAAGITLDFLLPVAMGYQFDRTEAGAFVANGTGDTGPEFERLTRELGLLESSEAHSVAIGTQLPLLPLYIPAVLVPEGRWMVGGKNTIKIKAQYSISIEGFIPIGDLWMDTNTDD